MKQNRKLWGIVAGIAALALLVGGTSIASNMGFKFVPNVGANEFFNLSLPWNNNYTTASTLFNDLPGAVSVRKINPSGAQSIWTASSGPAQDFAIVSGEGYVTEAGGSGITTAVIVGSHNPNQTLDFTAGEFFNAAAPYHQTLTTASQLFNDFNSQFGSATAVVSVSRITPSGSRAIWTASSGPAQDFSLDLGAAVVVEAGDGGTGYVWPHY